jgi:hypothetical protein
LFWVCKLHYSHLCRECQRQFLVLTTMLAGHFCFYRNLLWLLLLGGLLMLGIGTPVYLAGGLWLVRRALDREAVA